ncbi:SRPBCC family protein [Bacillus sp. EB01]|uniref:SRPBCC family protein n=1 Tax=Bacillus sp. EB01 TaxID=1347086 RepID=UPI0005C62214|nr:SRPBCC family protein [Bacillus sp. EB01]
MPIIQHKEWINAPIEVCFDLARNVDIHIQTTSATKERAVGGVAKGLLELGNTVTWEAVHFGIKQRLTAKVTMMERPHIFVDIMVKGAFASFVHTHKFVEEKGGTLMMDTFKYKSPLGVIGILADKLFLEKYMKVFIESRAKGLKDIAESSVEFDFKI